MTHPLKRTNWSREEALACFNLYCRLPFGRLHRSNPEVVALAESIGRTSSAVAMKLVNFASFDPVHKKRNVSGLKNASALDRAIWQEFESVPNRLAQESEEAFESIRGRGRTAPQEVGELQLPDGPTEKVLSRPMRLVQNFFRRAVLASYGYKCSICRLAIPDLLNASHIIPWNVSIELRADPRNGICLCALHDRAFDRGLITIDVSYRVTVSQRLAKYAPVPVQEAAFVQLAGKRVTPPKRFTPLAKSLDYHRSNVFRT